MNDTPLGPGEATRVRRLPAKARYDHETIFAIIDESRMCHVAGVVNGLAMTLPTLHVREGRNLYFHGSPSNAMFKAILASGRASCTMSIYDGLRLARSGFESSIAYRSVVVVGSVSLVEHEDEKKRLLDRFIDVALPGRAQEVRAMSDMEQRLTMVVALSIDEASAKVSVGPTEDSDEDAALAIWSGTVPAHLVFDEPVASSDGAMAGGTIEVPPSVRRLLDQQK